MSYGIVEGNEIADAGNSLKAEYPTLKSALGALPAVRDAASTARRIPLDGVELLPPIPDPGKIFCIGHNLKAGDTIEVEIESVGTLRLTLTAEPL